MKWNWTKITKSIRHGWTRINTDEYNVSRRACSRFDVPKGQQIFHYGRKRLG